ncbi:hypothetical protein [Empedobacter sp. GD03739]|uniref:hypothetical protein n=1 Tax=Empedobacter sp. GD03739 TaxID=2975376 RepID=UPI002448AFC2|nr:hypothetical protein [Empedobacter sp. GD03739]MDH1602376.1 hypothetical protein [Empedobacter sp. GD03739]
MGVVRGKRSVKIKEKIKAVQIQSTANLFQGPVPANITLKAVPQGFTALNYKWYINAGTSIVGTNQTFIIANNQVETTNVYKVVVTSIDGESFEATISIAKVKDGSAIVALKRYMDELITQHQQLNANYNSLYSNPKIGTYQSTLHTAYVDYVAEYNILVNYITAIITQNSFSEAEETVLNGYIANYRLKLVDLVNALETALKLTTDYLDDTITRINEITSFLDTTINGNVIGTGVLMVGSETQSNAGISGLNEAGSKSVRLWAGGTAQNRDKANWVMLDDGTERTFHSNGNLASERGLVDGSPIFNFYHKDGYLLFKLDPNRGLVNVAYIPESWTNTPMININQSSSTLNVASAQSFLNSLVLEDFRYHGQIGEDGFYRWYFNNNYTSFEYQNGTHPDNSQYENLIGYKTMNDSRTANIPNGWYGLQIGTIANAFGEYPPPRPTVNYILYYIENGKVVKTQNINF